MYSSIYRVQSSTRRLPIRALFGFMLKPVEFYFSLPLRVSVCGGLSLVSTLGRLNLPILFISLPRMWWFQHTYLACLLADDIHERYSAYILSVEHYFLSSLSEREPGKGACFSFFLQCSGPLCYTLVHSNINWPPHWPVDPWNSNCGCSTSDLSSCHPPVTPISGTAAYHLSPDLEFCGTQAVLPSIWVIQSHHDISMTHPALHYSSFLTLLIPIMPPYQSLTNHLKIMMTVLLLNSWLILYSLPAWHHFCLPFAYAPLFTHLFTHPLYSAPYSASPLHLLTPIIPLTNPLQVADQFLTKYLVNFVYKAIGPPVYKPAAKGCKRVLAWPSIYILILSVTAYPLLCLWTCRSLVLA